MANQAAWLTAAKVTPFEITEASMPEPRAGEIVIRNHAAAINPVDAIVQELGILVKEYPAILGSEQDLHQSCTLWIYRDLMADLLLQATLQAKSQPWALM